MGLFFCVGSAHEARERTARLARAEASFADGVTHKVRRRLEDGSSFDYMQMAFEGMKGVGTITNTVLEHQYEMEKDGFAHKNKVDEGDAAHKNKMEEIYAGSLSKLRELCMLHPGWSFEQAMECMGMVD